MVTNRCALIAVLLAFLALPALASAAPTASQISSPASPLFVEVDIDHPGSTFHVAGTTSGGTGDVDLRCYSGGNGPVVKSGVPVVNGAFATDVALTEALMNIVGDPEPYCILRAVPTGTVPAAAPGSMSPWQGQFIGWGRSKLSAVGSGYNGNDDKLWDYFVARAQSGAINDFDSIGSCGLCDTWLFKPGDKGPSNPIWWANSSLFPTPVGFTDRTSVRVDGVNAYSADSAYNNYGVPGHHMANNAGFPGLTVSHSFDSATGNLTIHESAPYVTCVEQPNLFPPTAVSCDHFAPSGVAYERTIRTSDNGHRVTIVDHWKSVDGKPHEVSLIYDDVAHSQNAAMAGHEATLQYPWINSIFAGYTQRTEKTPPPSVPATMFVKVDGFTSDAGDGMNPQGGLTYGSMPTKLFVDETATAQTNNSRWQAQYVRQIPAGGEVSIANGYSHDFALSSVQAKATELEAALAAPSLGLDSPADGVTIDAASAHVTGTVSSPDGKPGVKVNGVAATIDAGGHWTADVPLNEGSNLIVAIASNALGVTVSASRSVTRPAAPAQPAETTTPPPAATPTPVGATPKPVRCVVPKLKGKTLSKAKQLLKRAHCRLGKVSRKASTRVKPGRVVKTHLKPGSRVRAGTRVRVTLASKPAGRS